MYVIKTKEDLDAFIKITAEMCKRQTFFSISLVSAKKPWHGKQIPLPIVHFSSQQTASYC